MAGGTPQRTNPSPVSPKRAQQQRFGNRLRAYAQMGALASGLAGSTPQSPPHPNEEGAQDLIRASERVADDDSDRALEGTAGIGDRRSRLQQDRTAAGRTGNAVGKTTAAAGKAAQLAGKGTKAAGKGVEMAGKGAQTAGKGMEAAGKAAQAAGKAIGAAGTGIASAGKALSSTGLGAIVGVPMMLVGGGVKGGGAATQAAGGGVSAAGRVTQGAGQAAQAAGRATQAAGSGIESVGRATSQAGENMEEEAQEEQQEEQMAQQEAFSRKAALYLNQRSLDQQAQQDQEAQASQESTQQQQQKMRAGMRRGGMAGANAIAGALDSTGIGFLVGFFVHLGSIGDLLLEMIYGRHMAKGKSKRVPPISWEPFPLLPDLDSKAVILQVFLVTATIGLALATVTVGLIGVCVAYDVTTFVANPAQTTVAVASSSEGTCSGGIISTVFGL